ncbi:hypothetical protein G1H11_01915 [Phytoactinopolyspora alkaliphila]|uniref:Uncharacterized protein n=1 Tax=Phytoactinopolyspora alkaliphila TaxID=1783498 RepID=A0A6N9YGJ8_9ACTN|nr:hypothetical protein [Phytoactinopolyspora alkaliphila]NED94060.1 hypothetical protein [Phytoactinopolyspora alkaliphila]
MSDAQSSRSKSRQGRLGRLAGAVTGRVVETIDPDSVIEHVDVDALLDRVDVNRLLDRIDVNRLLERVDVDRLMDRVDVNRLVARVDLDAALENVDLEAAVRRAGVPEIVAESTGRVAGSALDLARRQIVGLDVVVDRLVNRLLRRDPEEQPWGPPRLSGERPA